MANNNSEQDHLTESDESKLHTEIFQIEIGSNQQFFLQHVTNIQTNIARITLSTKRDRVMVNTVAPEEIDIFRDEKIQPGTIFLVDHTPSNFQAFDPKKSGLTLTSRSEGDIYIFYKDYLLAIIHTGSFIAEKRTVEVKTPLSIKIALPNL